LTIIEVNGYQTTARVTNFIQEKKIDLNRFDAFVCFFFKKKMFAYEILFCLSQVNNIYAY